MPTGTVRYDDDDDLGGSTNVGTDLKKNALFCSKVVPYKSTTRTLRFNFFLGSNFIFLCFFFAYY